VSTSRLIKFLDLSNSTSKSSSTTRDRHRPDASGCRHELQEQNREERRALIARSAGSLSGRSMDCQVARPRGWSGLKQRQTTRIRRWWAYRRTARTRSVIYLSDSARLLHCSRAGRLIIAAACCRRDIRSSHQHSGGPTGCTSRTGQTRGRSNSSSSLSGEHAVRALPRHLGHRQPTAASGRSLLICVTTSASSASATRCRSTNSDRFLPTSWGESIPIRRGPDTERMPHTNRQEIWFRGSHSDVGGAWTTPRRAPRWMLNEAARAGLTLTEKGWAATTAGDQ
jgi:hypothetical protein